MKVPLEWLKEYVTLRLDPPALAEKLTLAGLEVAAIHAVRGDTIFDLEITPNRPDCLSMLGIAREVAAITGQMVKMPGSSAKARAGAPSGATPTSAGRQPALNAGALAPTIRIEDKKSCERYLGRLLLGVKIGPSPDWMQRRLLACGTRPINNIVDITNYVLLEYGQPLHAFDFYKLAQQTILVRRAHPDEPITTLDGVARKLSPEMLVIADAKQPVAVAGVMGGIGSEVTEATRDVLLESALFDPITVRRTARKLGLASESSYRFERGVDPSGVDVASQRAAALILELAGGRESAVVDVGAKPTKRTGILLEPARVQRWLGVSIPETTIRTTLARLGCQAASGGARGAVHVSVPSFRRDLVLDVDLIEELARLTGFDKIPPTRPTVPLPSGSPSEETLRYRRLESLRCLCASLGLTEAVTWSLISEDEVSRCGFVPADVVKLVNPLSQDQSCLRPSLLPGLLHAIRRNVAHHAPAIHLFELGAVVPRGGLSDSGAARHPLVPAIAGTSGQERTRLGIILSGAWLADWRNMRTSADFWVLKGLVQALTDRLCDQPAKFETSNAPWAEAGRSASIQLGGTSAGLAGQVSRAITAAWDVDQPVWYAELNVDALLAHQRQPKAITLPSGFPPVKRDLSVLVADATPYAEIEGTIREIIGSRAGRIELIDRFAKGAQIPAGKHSLTFSIEYRNEQRTLTAEEADAIHRNVGLALQQRHGATVR